MVASVDSHTMLEFALTWLSRKLFTIQIDMHIVNTD